MIAEPPIATPRSWAKLVIAVAVVFGIFHLLADALGSVRGEAGLVVGAIVVALVLAADRWWLGERIAWVALRAPAGRGMVAAGAIAVALLLVFPVVALAGGSRLAVLDGWLWLVPGLFAQAGIAEELLFRGLLFAYIRRGRGFWRAAGLSMLPFVAVHLFLFWTLPWPIALASVALSVVISFPFAHAFEIAGRTIWAPALLHFVIQGAIKLISLDGSLGERMPLIWMAASAALPFLIFLVRRPR